MIQRIQTILSYVPEGALKMDYNEEGNWQKPLRDGHKEFVGHPFYQQFFWRLLKGFDREEFCLFRLMAGEDKCSERLSHLHWQVIWSLNR